MRIIPNSLREGQCLNCSECQSPNAQVTAAWGWPPVVGKGLFLFPLCPRHAEVFRAKGPKFLPAVWRSAVLKVAELYLKSTQVATEVLQ
jgi:hypothetical protein